MVGTDFMERLAMRYDTVVSRAFRRALGVEAPLRKLAGKEAVDEEAEDVDPDVLWCFRNYHTVMDGPRRGPRHVGG